MAAAHSFQTDDRRLQPIYEKVMAHERLDADDALALYRTGDILAVGWLANQVRERLHGDRTYFNVNRHINPTNVCIAACRLCAFGRKKDSPGAYTMALEEAFETAASVSRCGAAGIAAIGLFAERSTDSYDSIVDRVTRAFDTS